MSEQKNTSLSSQVQAQTVFIYLLKDPDTLQPRYIGKSIRPYQRLQNHCNEPPSNCHRSHWIQSLKSQGKKPLLEVVERIEGGLPWQDTERLWIKLLRDAGIPLTNNTDGGDGVPALPPETRERIRMASVGRRPTPEQLAKQIASRRGRKSSDATKRLHSIAMRGRKILWIEKIAKANRKLTVEQVREIEDRLTLGEAGRDLGVEFEVHRTTISKIKMGTYFVGKLHPNQLREKLACRKKPKRFSPAKCAEVLALLGNGSSMRIVSSLCGVSTPVIRQIRDGNYFI